MFSQKNGRNYFGKEKIKEHTNTRIVIVSKTRGKRIWFWNPCPQNKVELSLEVREWGWKSQEKEWKKMNHYLLSFAIDLLFFFLWCLLVFVLCNLVLGSKVREGKPNSCWVWDWKKKSLQIHQRMILRKEDREWKGSKTRRNLFMTQEKSLLRRPTESA